LRGAPPAQRRLFTGKKVAAPQAGAAVGKFGSRLDGRESTVVDHNVLHG
jgi:hypothetical protein